MVFAAFFCLLALLVLAVFLAPVPQEPVARVAVPDVPDSGPGLSVPVEPPPRFAAKDLEAELKLVAEQYPASYGVVVSDPVTGKTVTMNPDQVHLAASLTKLPVLLSLYRAAALGYVDLDAPITMTASDVQAYGTGVLFREPVGTTMTLRECAELMIKESDNTAWVMLNRYMGRAHVEAELYEMGAHSTAYWIPNTTTAHDVYVMLEKVADPSYTSPELSAEMLATMTDTSFEDRLPQPLPESVRVAHKIGTYGDTFSDAGLVFPEGSESVSDAYYIVVIAGDTTEYEARAAIQDMSLAAYESLASTRPTGHHGREQEGGQ